LHEERGISPVSTHKYFEVKMRAQPTVCTLISWTLDTYLALYDGSTRGVATKNNDGGTTSAIRVLALAQHP
jgi:hypothetical protein